MTGGHMADGDEPGWREREVALTSKECSICGVAYLNGQQQCTCNAGPLKTTRNYCPHYGWDCPDCNATTNETRCGETGDKAADAAWLHSYATHSKDLDDSDRERLFSIVEAMGYVPVVTAGRTKPLEWYMGPTEWDPDHGKMWHTNCDGEILYIDDGWICSKCSAQEDDETARHTMKACERQPCSHGNATGHCQHCLEAL